MIAHATAVAVPQEVEVGAARMSIAHIEAYCHADVPERVTPVVLATLSFTASGAGSGNEREERFQSLSRLLTEEIFAFENGLAGEEATHSRLKE